MAAKNHYVWDLTLAPLSTLLLARGEIRFDGNWRTLTGTERSVALETTFVISAGLFTGGLIYLEDESRLWRKSLRRSKEFKQRGTRQSSNC